MHVYMRNGGWYPGEGFLHMIAQLMIELRLLHFEGSEANRDPWDN